MKLSDLAKSGIETCIFAVQVWGAFFVFTAIAQIAFPEWTYLWLMVVFAGILALGAISYHWFSKVGSRKELANLSLLVVAILIVFDLGAAVTE